MPDVEALRQALAAFLGAAQYRKFVAQTTRRGRLAFWQDQAWRRFNDAHPEFAVSLDELTAALRVCHLHGDELRPNTVEVVHGCRDLTKAYVDACNRLFPHAALDAISTEGRPFEGKYVAVWFCPSCREAAAKWRKRHDLEGRNGYPD
jgi:hypothetical protein